MSMRQVYRKIAKKHGVSVEEVKNDMQEALNHAYNNTSKEETTKLFQNQIPKRDQIPTPEEFIQFAANNLNKLNTVSNTRKKEK